MKRIVVRGVLEDLKNTAAVTKERERMIAEADGTVPEAQYPVNILANELHPKYFPIDVIKTEKFANGMYVEFALKNDGAVFRFKGGQWLGIRYTLKNEEKFSSLPVMSVSGKENVEVYFTKEYDRTAFEYFSSNKKKTPVGVSFEGNMLYSGIRDAENVTVITDETAFAAAVGFARNILKDYNGVTVNVYAECEKELVDKAVLVTDIDINPIDFNARLNSDKGHSVFIVGEKEFCNKAYKAFIDDEKQFASVKKYPVNIVGEYKSDKEFKCTVLYRGQKREIVCFEGERLSCAFLRAGVPTEVRCSDGRCGYCRCKLVCGKTAFLGTENDYSTAADKKYGYIHPCCTTALSDIVVEI